MCYFSPNLLMKFSPRGHEDSTKLPCCKWRDCKEHQLESARPPETSSHFLITFLFLQAVKELSCGEEAEGCRPLLLPPSRLQKQHAKSSLSLTRAARMTAALLSCCMHGCLHGCMTACMLPFTCCPEFHGHAGDSKLRLPFLPLGVRKEAIQKKKLCKTHLETILLSLGKGTPWHLQNTSRVTLKLTKDKAVYGCHFVFVNFFSYFFLDPARWFYVYQRGKI